MSLHLFDTFSREEKELRPLDGKKFRFYCCGPTVYGPAHIGNFRTFLMQDVMRRTLEAGGVETVHARNVTDVDDKTIRQSQAEGRSLSEFTTYWKDRFHQDCVALNMLPPTLELGAVDHIPDQISLISRLVEKGIAYEKGGSVYFKVTAFPEYGRLSRLKDRQITTNCCAHHAHEEVEDADEYQRDSAADFALWKARKPEDGPNFWQSPWGEGRPGWHIECSAMAIKYLGDSFDLHSGGVDLVFPHHENEIAQSEAATGQPFCAHWFHIAHLLVSDQKMSKSLGNLYTIEDIKKQGHTAMEARYVLISGHYRQPLNYTVESLVAAKSALEKMARFDKSLGDASGRPKWSVGDKDGGAFETAWESLNKDLNTPKSLGELFSAIKVVEGEIKSGAKADALKSHWAGWQRILFALGIVPPVKEESQAPAEVSRLAAERWAAKQAKDFAKADTLRQQITSLGWVMRDRKDGYDLTPQG